MAAAMEQRMIVKYLIITGQLNVRWITAFSLTIASDVSSGE